MTSNAKATHSAWQQLCDYIAKPDDVSGGPRTLILAAHQDDETIGATAAMTRLADCPVAFLTDGAPRDARYRSADATGSRDDYAKMRHDEALNALTWAGIAEERVYDFGCVDQEAVHHVMQLVNDLLSLLREVQPEIVITHAYEGGHPDHDAASLIAHLAGTILENRQESTPEWAEMALYYALDNRLVTHRFLPVAGPEFVIRLDRDEQERKRRMLACYRSQAVVLQSFGTEIEILRPAPAYDFTQAPHAGKLWYECLGWPRKGAEWRALAAAVLDEFDLTLCR